MPLWVGETPTATALLQKGDIFQSMMLHKDKNNTTGSALCAIQLSSLAAVYHIELLRFRGFVKRKSIKLNRLSHFLKQRLGLSDS